MLCDEIERPGVITKEVIRIVEINYGRIVENWQRLLADRSVLWCHSNGPAEEWIMNTLHEKFT